jgi:hypothetical protein
MRRGALFYLELTMSFKMVVLGVCLLGEFSCSFKICGVATPVWEKCF